MKKQKTINIVTGIVLAFDFFVIGFNAACGKYLNTVGLLIMAICLLLIVYQGNKNTKALEEMKKVDDVLPYAAALAIIARHLKDESEKKENEPSCSAENNDNIEFVHNAEGGNQ